jgi:hypothetical protein
VSPPDLLIFFNFSRDPKMLLELANNPLNRNGKLTNATLLHSIHPLASLDLLSRIGVSFAAAAKHQWHQTQ